MKSNFLHAILAGAACWLLHPEDARGITLTFFNNQQPAASVSSGPTSETFRSAGYLFTYTLDKYWSPSPGGTPTGRPISIRWPGGIGAQTQTAGPGGPITQQSPATITIRREDGRPFSIPAFTAKILGSTAGAGASIEIMPLLDGQDAWQDPLALDATGYAGAVFPYSTPQLAGFDTYIISLWMDFGLTSLTLVDDSPPTPVALLSSLTATNTIRLAWPADAYGYRLQSSTDVDPAAFTPVPGMPSFEGVQQALYLPASDRRRFYRLSQ